MIHILRGAPKGIFLTRISKNKIILVVEILSLWYPYQVIFIAENVN